MGGQKVVKVDKGCWKLAKVGRVWLWPGKGG
jgi:hypothetical protein